MTVGELRQKIKNLPANMPVFLLTDKSPENWDVDNDRWHQVWPLSYVTRERVYSENMFDDDEYNLILEVEEL
jgi:hypothetical protein